jgi:hypothetical protein
MGANGRVKVRIKGFKTYQFHHDLNNLAFAGTAKMQLGILLLKGIRKRSYHFL